MMNASETSSPNEAGGGQGRFLTFLSLGLIILLLLPFFVPTTQRVVAGLSFPYEVDSEEGFVLWQAWQLRHGRNIFRPLDSPPYVAATYGPLFPAINAAFLWGKVPTFFGGRLMVAMSVVAICVFMALIIWRETRQVLAALLGLLLFLNSYDVYQWLPLYRVDFPALALGMAGLWLLSGHERPANVNVQESRPPKWRWRAMCACFVAMIYARQVEVAPFVAALAYLFLRDRTAALRLLRNVAAWGLGIAAVLALLTRGQFLIHNIYYNANPFSLWQLRTVLIGTYLDDGRYIGGHFYKFNRFFAVVFVVCIVWFLIERLRREREISNAGSSANGQDASTRSNEWRGLDLFALYAAVASLAIFGVGKMGAATNYLIEPRAAWSLFVALTLGRAIRLPAAPERPLVRPFLFSFGVLVLAAHTIEFLCSSTLVPAVRPWVAQHPDGVVSRFVSTPVVLRYLSSRPQLLFAADARNPTTADLVNCDRLVEALGAANEPVLCEHPILATHAGRTVYMQPFIMSQLAREGKWNQAPVVEAVRKREFSRIITTEDLFKEGYIFHYTREMVEAIRASYRLREAIGGGPFGPTLFTYFIYEPRQPRQRSHQTVDRAVRLTAPSNQERQPPPKRAS